MLNAVDDYRTRITLDRQQTLDPKDGLATTNEQQLQPVHEGRPVHRGVDLDDEGFHAGAVLAAKRHIEAFVRPRRGRMPRLAEIEQAQAECRALDWKMHDVVIVPVREFPETASARSGES